MTMLEILPVLAYAAVICVILLIATGHKAVPALRWALPTAAALAFFIYSFFTVTQGGILPFWVNHTTNLAGNQFWFDLLMAVAISFYLIVPRARAVGMNVLPWAVAVVATACIALLPMLARMIWLEQRAVAPS